MEDGVGDGGDTEMGISLQRIENIRQECLKVLMYNTLTDSDVLIHRIPGDTIRKNANGGRTC